MYLVKWKYSMLQLTAFGTQFSAFTAPAGYHHDEQDMKLCSLSGMLRLCH